MSIDNNGIPRLTFNAQLQSAPNVRATRSAAEVWGQVAGASFQMAGQLQEFEAKVVEREASKQGAVDYASGKATLDNIPQGHSIRQQAYRRAALNGHAVDLDMEMRTQFNSIYAENEYSPEELVKRTDEFVRAKQEALAGKAPELLETFTLSAGKIRSDLVLQAQQNVIRRSREEAIKRSALAIEMYGPEASNAYAKGDSEGYEEALSKIRTTYIDAVNLNAMGPAEAMLAGLEAEKKIRNQGFALKGMQTKNPLSFVSSLPKNAAQYGMNADDVVEIMNKTTSYQSQRNSLIQQQQSMADRASRIAAGRAYIDLLDKADRNELTQDEVREFGKKYGGSADVGGMVKSLYNERQSNQLDLGQYARDYEKVRSFDGSVEDIQNSVRNGAYSPAVGRSLIEQMVNRQENAVFQTGEYKSFDMTLDGIFPTNTGASIPGMPKGLLEADTQALDMRRQIETEVQRRLIEKPEDIQSIHVWGNEIVSRVVGPNYIERQTNTLSSQVSGMLGSADWQKANMTYDQVVQTIAERYPDEREAATRLKEYRALATRINELSKVKLETQRRAADRNADR